MCAGSRRGVRTVESVYQCRKCVFYGDFETADKTLSKRTGLQAKYLSKTIKEKVHLRSEWNKQRRSIMYALAIIKFRNVALRKHLLGTQQAPLTECVINREGFWGLQSSGLPGQNSATKLLD